MNRAVFLLLAAGAAALAGAALGVGCSASFDSKLASYQHTTSSVGGGNHGGDAGLDADFGGGSSPSGPVSYTALCGAGCLPGTGVSEPCAGGAGGSAGQAGDCVLTFDEATQHLGGSCTVAGLGYLDDPCLATAYCGPGLACDEGRCRPYCCGDLEACPADSYCTPRPVDPSDLPANVSPVPEMPVCVAVEPCQLLSPASCAGDQTCTIVRADGTTSCVTPGTHTAGQSCPCAPDHYCATALDTCFQLCRINSNTDCPSGFTCQGGSDPFPSGFGVCVQK